MTPLIIIVMAIAITFFTYQGFCTRCPNCAYWGLNKHLKIDKSSKQYDDLIKNVSNVMKDNLDTREYSDLIGRKGFANKTLTCKMCEHKFSRSLASEWQKISNKLSEEVALEEYHKLNKDH